MNLDEKNYDSADNKTNKKTSTCSRSGFLNVEVATQEAIVGCMHGGREVRL